MEVKQEMKIITFCNDHYRVTNIRRIKLVRELDEGEQRRLNEWDY